MSVPPSLDGYSSSSKRSATADAQDPPGAQAGDLEQGESTVAEVAPDYELRPAPRMAPGAGRPVEGRPVEAEKGAGAEAAAAGQPGGAGARRTTQRIYLVGAHSTGKTTLARWVRDRFGMPMISEVARGVLAEMEAQLDALRSDVELVNRYQRQVFERWSKIERASVKPCS